MKNWRCLFAVLSATLFVVSCTKIGSNVAVTGVPLVNGLAATKLKDGLTQKDIKLAVVAEYKALKYTPTGGVEYWQNPKSGNSGEVKVGQPYRIGDRDCRRYQHLVVIKGVEKRANGTACKNSQDIWAGLE